MALAHPTNQLGASYSSTLVPQEDDLAFTEGLLGVKLPHKDLRFPGDIKVSPGKLFPRNV
jgi:hypothetical protein